MSWSISAEGTKDEIATRVREYFAPLKASNEGNLYGEREYAGAERALLAFVETAPTGLRISLSGNGHAGYSREYQVLNVQVSITAAK